MREELAWAVAKRDGWELGKPTGLYFHYYRTEAEAKRAASWYRKQGKDRKVECRPNECYRLGWI
jgi:hypothetical protein